jgi:outer membrane cobalamin receptor
MVRVILGIAAVALAPAAARAEDPSPRTIEVDADGDGDIDDADRALLAGEAGEVIEVEGSSAAESLRDSARPATVVELDDDRARAADLGEVLSRAQGVQVRRSGGLGSQTRFSLNGLYDDQVRFFLDGAPLELSGWAGGVADVPVEHVERVEVHRGVVPIALGADALGGAVDLVTDPRWDDRAAASYQVGSFGTHRATATGRVRHDASGLAAGMTAFVDRAANDYPIDVEVPDEVGRLREARVRRFHDGYRAQGGHAEVGLIDRGAVRRALLRVHVSDRDKDLQHNTVMTVPYGEVTSGERARGAGADVVVTGARWSARGLAGISSRRIDFRDRGRVIYDWHGEPVGERQVPGEIGDRPIDQRVTEVAGFARVTAELDLPARQRLRFAVAPTVARRDGVDRTDPNPDGRDPLGARRDLAQSVVGVEHELIRLEDDALQNLAFVKHYALWTWAEDVRPGYVFVPIEDRTQRLGVGDAARLRVLPWLALKASYEWATRLPSVDEVFGDGVLVNPNLELEPETSHNVNLGARAEVDGPAGELGSELTLFARVADDLIILLGDDRSFTHQNVWSARVLGVEGTAAWVAPREIATVEVAATIQDIRNASSEGTFGAFEGDRIPNRPWLFGSASLSTTARDLVLGRDALTLFGSTRYVHDFFRGWESLGRRDSKQVVASQLVHGLGVSYELDTAAGDVVTTLELQNLTDAHVFDSYGVQRPGRALFLKLTGEI